MITSLTPDQASYIASVLSTLKGLIPYPTDGFSITVNLHDDNYAEPVGKFSEVEGAWLFDFLPLPAPKLPTLDEVAQIVFESNPDYYRDRKIAHIKETRGRWADLTGTPSSLVDTKRAVENVRQDVALAELRAKLVGDTDAPAYDEDAEWRAQARAREAQAESGTWFGVPGPMDEEPF